MSTETNNLINLFQKLLQNVAPRIDFLNEFIEKSNNNKKDCEREYDNDDEEEDDEEEEDCNEEDDEEEDCEEEDYEEEDCEEEEEDDDEEDCDEDEEDDKEEEDCDEEDDKEEDCDEEDCDEEDCDEEDCEFNEKQFICYLYNKMIKNKYIYIKKNTFIHKECFPCNIDEINKIIQDNSLDKILDDAADDVFLKL